MVIGGKTVQNDFTLIKFGGLSSRQPHYKVGRKKNLVHEQSVTGGIRFLIKSVLFKEVVFKLTHYHNKQRA